MSHDSCTKTRIEWMWKSNENPWSSSKDFEWHSYSDVETAIIEEGYQARQPEVLLDDYHINFKHGVQISNNNINNQRPVKRTVNERNEAPLREERFMPNPISPTAPFTHMIYPNERGGRFWQEAYYYLKQVYNLDMHKDPNVLPMIVKKAAEGLIVEGKKIGKQKEGEWLARQLLSVKDKTREEIWQCCARLYCVESFLYKKLNETMRLSNDTDHRNLWQSKVASFGPFVLLFERNLEDCNSQQPEFVYRGVNLSNDLIEHYQKIAGSGRFRDGISFPAFTSTTRNREKAEMFGNTLFIINTVSDFELFSSLNISPYSDYDEEEELLQPRNNFDVISCVFDATKNKWEIRLRFRPISP